MASIQVLTRLLFLFHSSLFFFSHLVTGQQGSCPLPADPSCVIRSSQFVILGTVTKTNQYSPEASPRSYNATIAVQCVWGSFSSPPSNGYGLVNTIVPVQGFGKPLANCPNGGGSEATEGSTQIFFIYLQKGVMTGPSDYAVSNPCAGPLDYTPENVQLIASAIAASPASKIADAYRGTKDQCVLPAVSGSGTSSTSGTVSSPKTRAVVKIPPPDASGVIHSSIAASLFLCSFLFVILFL